jgi:hypothetical protein
MTPEFHSSKLKSRLQRRVPHYFYSWVW